MFVVKYSEYRIYESMSEEHEQNKKKFEEEKKDPVGELVLVLSVIGLGIYYLLLFLL